MGESRHALARAMFFHRLGELRDRTAEDMAHRASGLNLVVNAIVLWNTTYLARAVAYARGQGVALTGDYLWSDVQTPRNRFRPLRTQPLQAGSVSGIRRLLRRFPRTVDSRS